MGQFGFGDALQFGYDALSQHLAEFNSPLVERVELPDRALCEDNVFIQSDQFAENFGGEPVGKDSVRRTVAFKNPVRDQPIGRALGFDLLGCLAESEGLGLRKNV